MMQILSDGLRQTGIFLAVLLVAPTGEVQAVPQVAAVSLDKRVRIEVSLRSVGEMDAVPHYRVTFDGKEVVGHSRLGVELDGGTALGGSCEVLSVDARTVRDEFIQVTGKRRAVRVDATEVTVALRETTGARRKWEVHLRACDDAVAFRYHFPKQDGWDALAVKQERTEFRVPAEARAFALPLNGFTTSYETRYQRKPLRELPKD